MSKETIESITPCSTNSSRLIYSNFSEKIKQNKGLSYGNRQITAKYYEGLGDINFRLCNVNNALYYFVLAFELSSASSSQASALLRKMMKTCNQATNMPHEIVLYLHELATQFYEAGNIGMAISFYNVVIKTTAASDKYYTHDNAILHNNTGIAYEASNDMANALLHHHKALDIYQSLYPKGNDTILNLLHNISHIYFKLKQPQQVLESCNIALTITRQLYPDHNSSKVASVLHSAGMAYESLEKFDRAVQCFERALQVLEKFFPQDKSCDLVRSNISRISKLLLEQQHEADFENSIPAAVNQPKTQDPHSLKSSETWQRKILQETNSEIFR